MDNRTIVSSIDVTKQIASATLRSVSASAATPLASDTALKSAAYQHQQQHNLLAISRFSRLLLLARSLHPLPLPLKRIHLASSTHALYIYIYVWNLNIIPRKNGQNGQGWRGCRGKHGRRW